MTAESGAVLLSLAVAGALVPGPILVTVLLLRARGGLVAAAAFVAGTHPCHRAPAPGTRWPDRLGASAGMTVVRLAQGPRLRLRVRCRRRGGSTDPGAIESVFLLVLAIVFFIAAGRKALADDIRIASTGAGCDDPDRPPPAWKSRIASMSALVRSPSGPATCWSGSSSGRRSPWAQCLRCFTLGGLAAIEDAAPGPGPATLAFTGFVAMTQSIPLLIVAASVVMPGRSPSPSAPCPAGSSGTTAS